MVDPDRWPTSDDASGRCPRCGHVATFGRSVSTNVGKEYCAAYTCHNCHGLVVVVERFRRTRGDPPTPPEVLHGWPARGAADLDQDVPSGIASAFQEGQRALSADAPRAAATMFRGMLAEVVRDKGSAAAAGKSTLYEQLRVLADEGSLHPSLADWAKEIRLVGNAGAHPDPLTPVSREDAAELADLARRFIEMVYEVPARIARSRQRRTP